MASNTKADMSSLESHAASSGRNVTPLFDDLASAHSAIAGRAAGSDGSTPTAEAATPTVQLLDELNSETQEENFVLGSGDDTSSEYGNDAFMDITVSNLTASQSTATRYRQAPEETRRHGALARLGFRPEDIIGSSDTVDDLPSMDNSSWDDDDVPSLPLPNSPPALTPRNQTGLMSADLSVSSVINSQALLDPLSPRAGRGRLPLPAGRHQHAAVDATFGVLSPYSSERDDVHSQNTIAVDDAMGTTPGPTLRAGPGPSVRRINGLQNAPVLPNPRRLGHRRQHSVRDVVHDRQLSTEFRLEESSEDISDQFPLERYRHTRGVFMDPSVEQEVAARLRHGLVLGGEASELSYRSGDEETTAIFPMMPRPARTIYHPSPRRPIGLSSPSYRMDSRGFRRAPEELSSEPAFFYDDARNISSSTARIDFAMRPDGAGNAPDSPRRSIHGPDRPTFIPRQRSRYLVNGYPQDLARGTNATVAGPSRQPATLGAATSRFTFRDSVEDHVPEGDITRQNTGPNPPFVDVELNEPSPALLDLANTSRGQRSSNSATQFSQFSFPLISLEEAARTQADRRARGLEDQTFTSSSRQTSGTATPGAPLTRLIRAHLPSIGGRNLTSRNISGQGSSTRNFSDGLGSEAIPMSVLNGPSDRTGSAEMHGQWFDPSENSITRPMPSAQSTARRPVTTFDEFYSPTAHRTLELESQRARNRRHRWAS